jgi:hypothetical protein
MIFGSYLKVVIIGGFGKELRLPAAPGPMGELL